jgi:uncharacterized membrane protein YbhN (UPF0104 family)
VLVTDRLEQRIRKPADLLRALACALIIVVLAGLGIVASATTRGVETNIVEFSRSVPHTLLTTARPLALFALLILPVALAIRQILRRQPRGLAEAAVTGILTGAAVTAADSLLHHQAAARLYDAITMSRPGVSHVAALDAYLAGLVAYTTVIGLARRPRWQTALWVLIAVYALVNLATPTTTVLSLVISVLTGAAVGLGVRYAAGSIPARATAEEIAAALGSAGCPVAEMRRAWRPTGSESRRYAARARDGGWLDVYVYDWDQQAAGLLYRLYRLVRLQDQVSRGSPLSQDRAVERLALLSYAGADAGAPAPRLRALVRSGREAVVLAYEHHDGTTLAASEREPTDAQLGRIWDAVLALHARRVTHRALTADSILLTPDDGILLLSPGNGDVAATDLQLHLDLAQLTAELALRVGPEKSAGLAVAKVAPEELLAIVPLLQSVALSRSTRRALRQRREVLPALRKRLLDNVPGAEVTPVHLERIRLRTLATLVVTVVAAYLLAGELTRASLATVVRSADWRWGVAALAFSALTYVGAALSLTGFVTERLSFLLTILAQLAGSFVTLVTPAAVGGVALNIRYLQREKITAPIAAASVGVSQVVAFVLHILLLVVFLALTGTSESHRFRLPAIAYFVLVGLVAVALAAAAIPAGRRLLRARVAPALSQVLPGLLKMAQHPGKIAQGVGGALLLSAAYIACLDVSIRALGSSIPIASVAVVYLTGSALGSLVPTPGGLGAVEAALSAGLTAAGLPGATAVSVVLLYRVLTFWLPVPLGWIALKYLERRNAL